MFTVDTDDETYTGDAITKLIAGFDADREAELVEGVDYVVTYTENTEAGTATITITGIGNYTGTLTYTFAIVEEEVDGTVIPVDTDDNNDTGGISGTDDANGTDGTGSTDGISTLSARTDDTNAPVLYGFLIALAGAAIVTLGVRRRIVRR